ncbi:hypothetical protein FA95DRAFT_1030043 [Auriscalpium vulgare]|uniref:Uncharacterized protein n=1 Tax=Auriscalpium vulgare TaxID=40419 RepID=A0ACB8R5M7_9AGAM|nr:hypothetical protein FA95DRAFT_1030043 [Auriscalpium vulgare]
MQGHAAVLTLRRRHRKKHGPCVYPVSAGGPCSIERTSLMTECWASRYVTTQRNVRNNSVKRCEEGYLLRCGGHVGHPLDTQHSFLHNAFLKPPTNTFKDHPCQQQAWRLMYAALPATIARFVGSRILDRHAGTQASRITSISFLRPLLEWARVPGQGTQHGEARSQMMLIQ